MRERTSLVCATLFAHPISKLPLPVRNVAVAVFCLVLDELFESGLPRYCWALHYECPLEANFVELIDEILRQFAILAGSPLIIHPRSKFSLTLWNVAVTMLCLVLGELVKSGLPRHFVPLFPRKADAVEPIDAILRKRIGPVGCSLMAYPLSNLAFAERRSRRAPIYN